MRRSRQRCRSLTTDRRLRKRGAGLPAVGWWIQRDVRQFFLNSKEGEEHGSTLEAEVPGGSAEVELHPRVSSLM